MDWLVKNAQNRDVERQHLNKILQDIRSTLNELEARMSRDSSEEARIRAVVSKMLTSGTQSGISVTYNATSKAIDFAVRTFTIQLTGDVTGTATVTGLGNVSINTTLAAENEGVEEAPLDGFSYWRNMGVWQNVPFPLETIQFLTLEPGGILTLDEELNWNARTIEGTASEIVVTDGDGIAANPVIGLADLPDDNTGTFKLITRDAKGRVEGTLDGDTDDVPEGVTNLYFTDARARTAIIAPTIVNGDTTHSPSGDAVFDALAGKEPTIAAGTTAQFWRGDKAWSNELRGDITFRNTSVNNEYKKLVTTATIANENLMGLNAYGANGSAEALGGTLNLRASEAWTSTANGSQFEVRLVAPGTTTLAVRMRVFGTGTVAPAVDNTQKLGESSLRWSEVFSGNGTINTSDQREKTSPRNLTNGEIACASDLAALPSIFQWLHAIQAKGEEARLHCSPTVQAVISCMESHGLDPFRYGFVCYDRWDELPEVWEERQAHEAVVDDDGNVIKEAVKAGRELVQEYRPAGDRYSLRPSELQFFIIRGQEERLRKLEQALYSEGL